MFNLTVSEAHTYYVGQDGWLVHNASGPVKNNTPILPKPSVSNATGPGSLGNIVNDFYKGTTKKTRIGTGTTADAIRYEISSGDTVQGKTHFTQKGPEMIKRLEGWLQNNPANASNAHDRLVAQSLLDDLRDAMGGC